MADTPAKPPVKPATANKARPVSPSTVQQATQMPTVPPPFRIRRVSRRERYLKLLIYGNYGTGKTYLAGTASEVPELRDVLMINAEAGDLTLDEFEHIDEITVQDFKMLARVYEFLKAHCAARDANDMDKLEAMHRRFFGEEGEPRKYRTVIVDSLSEIEQYCLNSLLGIAENTKLDDEVQSAEWAEYKKNNSMILRMVRNFRNLPMNVIFTCAESYTQDETKKMKFTLDLTGKLSKKVQGFMDMVGYLQAGSAVQEEGKPEVTIPRRLSVTPTPRFDAKHRYASFKGTHFDNPTIGKILKETGLLSKDGAVLKG